jgi:hypothetical protein
MKEIFVLNENGKPEQISAGVESYNELVDMPIVTVYEGVPLLGSSVTLIESKTDPSKLCVKLIEGNKEG